MEKSGIDIQGKVALSIQVDALNSVLLCKNGFDVSLYFLTLIPNLVNVIIVIKEYFFLLLE